MTTQYINPPGMREVAAYNHALIRPGIPVFITGQVAWDEDGKVVGVGDIGAQVKKTWENLGLVLDAMDADFDDIVKLTTYATDVAFREPIGKERASHFTAGRFPASTFLVVAGLADPDLLVEIEAIVVLAEKEI